MSPYPPEPSPWEPEDDRESASGGRGAEADADGHDSLPPEPVEYPNYPPEAFNSPLSHAQTDERVPSLASQGFFTQSTGTIVRTIVAWTLIVACTVGLFFLQQIGMEEMAKQAESDPSPGVQALYLARYAVGMNQVIGQGAEVMPQYDATVWASTHPRIAAVRGAILAGDLINRDEAIYRLDNLDAYLPLNAKPLNEDQQRSLEVISDIYLDASFVPSADQEQLLIENHGYFGELAVGYNLPPSNPQYASPRTSAKIVFLSIASLIGVVGLSFLLGAVLLVVLIVMLATKSQRIAMPRGPAASPVVYLEVVSLFLVGFIVLQLIFGLLGALIGIDLTLGFLLMTPIVLIWPLLLGVPWTQYKTDMGYHFGAGIHKEIASGIGGYLAGLPIIAVGFGLTFLLGRLTEEVADHPMQREIIDGRLFSVLLLVGAAVIWAPLVEESVFRSAFYRHMRQRSGVPGWLLATIVTSFIFAAIHPQGWIGIPVLMSIAFVLAGLREWRGSIIPSITAHALHNGTIMTGMLIVLYA